MSGYHNLILTGQNWIAVGLIGYVKTLMHVACEVL